MIDIKINSQPDDVTCGPTSLHSIYRYYGDSISLEQTIEEIKFVASGGTLAASLGTHALMRGYTCTIYVYNLEVFDPSWFCPEVLPNEIIIDKLKQQLLYKDKPQINEASLAYAEFLALGGTVLQKNLTPNLLKTIFSTQTPIITGLSATYLYGSQREYEPLELKINNSKKDITVYDDIRGVPAGHFVVLCGYDETHRHIVVADPHQKNPISGNNYYNVSISRLINSIMLGVLTYDANLLLIRK
jgi:hypothetical protein